MMASSAALPSVPIPAALGPSSPPQTPTPSPRSMRLPSPGLAKSRYPNLVASRRAFVLDPNIHPVGNGPHFNYTPSAVRPDLSPRSSSCPCPASASPEGGEEDGDGEDEDMENYADDDDSSLADADEQTPDDAAGGDADEDEDADADSDYGCAHSPRAGGGAVRLISTTTWSVEELSDVDPMQSESERKHLMRPYGIDEADSDWGSEASRVAQERMVHRFRNLDFSAGAGTGGGARISSSSSSSGSDEISAADIAYQEFNRKQKELRMKKRRSQSMASIGSKRTLSELSGDSDDREDLQPLDFNSAGSSARRMRRRTDRWSFHLQDMPPPPRIDEQDEPDEEGPGGRTGMPVRGGDNTRDRAYLMQELPYCRMEIMEVDSS